MDVPAGLKLLEAAAEKDAASKISLGNLLLKGEYLTPDVARSTLLFEEAAKKGNASGLEALGRYYLYSPAPISNEKKALDYLTQAGNKGLGSSWALIAQGIVGKRFKGTKLNFSEFAKKARAAVNPNIEIIDAERFLSGQGVQKNNNMFLQILTKAADQKNIEAARYLIKTYRAGRAPLIPQNLEKAAEYLKRYSALFTPYQISVEELLLKLTATKRTEIFEKIAADPINIQALRDPGNQNLISSANINFMVYMAQSSMKRGGVYNGPLDSLATSETISAMLKTCKMLIDNHDCSLQLLSPLSLFQISRNW